jgi:hypothetical protein
MNPAVAVQQDTASAQPLPLASSPALPSPLGMTQNADDSTEVGAGCNEVPTPTKCRVPKVPEFLLHKDCI